VAPITSAHACWLWTGALNDAGYGQLNIAQRPVKAHRLIYEIVNGPIPDGLCVLHRCDVRACVNPSHLFIGTRHDNVDDMIAKNRQNWVRGERIGCARLTEADVREIRAQTESHRAIWRRFGISKSQWYAIRKGHNWRHVA
jgi:hypothetical protein